MARTSAVFFDVDFTLIHPGPRFQDSGYQACCLRHGVTADAALFDAAVAGAGDVLDSADELYDVDLYVRYTARIIELMGGEGPGVERAARELYDDWAEHHHFSLYDDVVETLHALRDRDIKMGLISNSQRCLRSFQSHFELDGLLSVAVSSTDHQCMKPHPDLFRAALDQMKVSADESMMVGDSVRHDVVGAQSVGMRPVLLSRGGLAPNLGPDVAVIRSLRDLPALL